MTWQDEYLKRYYDPDSGWVDGTTEFHELCATNLPAGGRFLEIGAGPTNDTSDSLAGLGELHGVDPDPDVKNNTALASARVMEGGKIPWEDGSFDGCVSNWVVEHVQDPVEHLTEVARVLRPGAVYLFRTPNRFHYVSFVSSITPHWFHVMAVKKLRQDAADAHDPYPTVYALNSRRAVRRHARAAGLDVDLLRMIEKNPSYGMGSRVLFLAFTLYERIVNSTDLLQDARVAILGVLRKPTG